MAGGALGLAGNFRGERWGAGGGIGEDRGDLLLLDREIGRDNRPTCKFHSKTAVAAKKSPSNSSADDADTRAMKFEQAFGELEMLIGQMEGDELPLDEMVKAYERGTRLWNQCKLRLDEARLKVEAITKASEDGEMETETFDAGASAPAPAKPAPKRAKPSADDEIKLF